MLNSQKNYEKNECSSDFIKKPKIAIISLRNSYGYGGVLSLLKVSYDFCEKYFDPTVFFLSFDPAVSTSLRHLKFSSSIQPLNYFGMKCIEIGARWAFWEPGHYKFNLKHWEKALAGYDYFLAVSGTCICAHPLVQLNKKFGMLIATPYDDDRTRRVNELSGIRYLIDRAANKKMHQIERNVLEKAEFIWALSSYSKNEFEKILKKPSSKILCSGHPIDCSVPPTIKPKNENIIIAVGRYSDPRKNIDMLLRVFNKIYKSMPTAKLYIVGKTPDTSKLKQFNKLPFFQNIVFTGQVSASDLESLYQRASLLLLTSYQEGLGIVGLEALLHGVPVVATDCGGPADYAINNLTGYLVKINDDDDMAEKALSILSNKEKSYLMSYNSQKFVIENYSVNKIEKFFRSGFLKMYPELKRTFDLIDDRRFFFTKTSKNATKNHFL